MTKFDLNKREYGSCFAPFEYDLIFIKRQEHIGWVLHTSDRTFELKYSPFSNQTRKYFPSQTSSGAFTGQPLEYIVPNGCTMPSQNACIEITPLKIISDPHLPEKSHSIYGHYQNYCIVDKFEEYRININKFKPDISYNDYLYQISLNWKNAEADDLDIMLALQSASCPTSVYGKGGIGTMAAKISQQAKLSKNIYPELDKTYNSIIPANFQTLNSTPYFFKSIKTPSDRDFITKTRHNQNISCEVNYCNPCITLNEAQAIADSIPIQIPILIQNAQYKGVDALAEPYLIWQYQLSALMYDPTFGDDNNALTRTENNIKKVIEERGILNIDANAINKIAMGYSRLNFKKDVKADDIDIAIKLLFTHLEDWEKYIEQSTKTMNFRYSLRPSDMIFKHSSDHEKFLVELQKLHDETSEKWIYLSELEKKFDEKKRHLVNDIALDLNNAGMIIQQYNFSKVRKVDM